MGMKGIKSITNRAPAFATRLAYLYVFRIFASAINLPNHA